MYSTEVSTSDTFTMFAFHQIKINNIKAATKKKGEPYFRKWNWERFRNIFLKIKNVPVRNLEISLRREIYVPRVICLAK